MMERMTTPPRTSGTAAGPDHPAAIGTAASSRATRRNSTNRPIDAGDLEHSADDLPEDRFLNRELSWLDFNARVLALAEDPDTPLLERAKFLAIFASNLDEFYMVRVAGLKRRLSAGLPMRGGDRSSLRHQLEMINERTAELVDPARRLLRRGSPAEAVGRGHRAGHLGRAGPAPSANGCGRTSASRSSRC